MSWAAETYTGPANDFDGLELQSPPRTALLGARQHAHFDAASRAVKDLVDALGDCYVTVSAYGHANGQQPGLAGDTVTLSVQSVTGPPPPAP